MVPMITRPLQWGTRPTVVVRLGPARVVGALVRVRIEAAPGAAVLERCRARGTAVGQRKRVGERILCNRGSTNVHPAARAGGHSVKVGGTHGRIHPVQRLR